MEEVVQSVSAGVCEKMSHRQGQELVVWYQHVSRVEQVRFGSLSYRIQLKPAASLCHVTAMDQREYFNS